MLVAFDTATRLISVALHDGADLVYEATWRTANNHTVELSPALDRAMAQIRLTPADLSGVAVAQGPGSFTGLRIGMGLAKGLALAQQIPLLAVPTLEVVAYGTPPLRAELIAVIQAGRTRLSAQTFAWLEGGWQASSAAAILTWDQLAARVSSPVLVAGEVDLAGRAALEPLGGLAMVAPAAANLRRAGVLADLAWQRLQAGQTDDIASITPVYLHQPGVPHP